MLETFVEKGDVQTRVVCKDWQEAVDRGAAPLLARGVIEPRYVEAIKAHHREMGPYMVVAPGIARMHTRPEDGAKGVGLSILTLAEPVAFGNPENDPVRLVLTFATPDGEAHLRLLESLMDFLMETGKVEALLAAENEAEARAVLS